MTEPRLAEDELPPIEQRQLQWLLGNDTGISSRTIFGVLTLGDQWHGRHAYLGAGLPRDPTDLGRCIRLLEAIPEWRSRLPEMAAAFAEWGPLVRDWDALESLYREEEPSGTAPKCYEAMRARIEEGRRT